ncbi:transmembrane protein 134-like isoform X2 [Dreissena polymorpha]|uniref:transmembrane protein 134-like isoform X2 n=1 Tax=Dreissena polymorpha TaxID=45954 RepID=UPI002264E565|nr:transmembrane protein 134-like isoform X2 [Dreissena polymorpha]
MSLITHESITVEEPVATDDEDKVQVYGSTLSTTPSPAKLRQSSNFQEWEEGEDRKEHRPTSWMQHPKIQENWKVVLGAVMLTLIGSVLFFVGVGIVASPGRGMHCLVFFIGGLLCLIPGAYHLIYICLALRGCEGYSLYDLPVFN